MENEILELLKLNDKALSVYDIYDALNLKTTEDLKNLMKELNALIATKADMSLVSKKVKEKLS